MPEQAQTTRQRASGQGLVSAVVQGALCGGFSFDPDISYPFWSGATILLADPGVSLVRLSRERILERDATLKVAEGDCPGLVDDKVNPLVKTTDR